MQEAVMLVVFTPLAFVAALASGVLLAWLVQAGWRRPDMLLPATVFPLLMLFALTCLTIQSGATSMSGVGDGRHWSVALGSKLTSMMLMGAALERLLHRMIHSQSLLPSPMRLTLLLGFSLFWATNVFSPMLFGAHRLISHEYVYSLVLGWAALIALADDGASMIRCCRDGLLAFLVAGLLLLPFAPHLVLSNIESALLPFPPTRYSGLAGQPNQLGPMAVVFLLCLWHSPCKRRALNWFGLSVAFISLLLAGSKTTLLAFLPVAIAVLIACYGRKLPLLWRDPRYFKVLNMLILLAILAAIGLGALLMWIDPDRINAWLRSSEAASAVTVTGRDVIWRAALDEWHRWPVFGYGLTMWDAAFRAKIQVEAAYHAHNQLLHSLGVAGLVGAFGLITWLLVLGTAAVRCAGLTRGFSVGLFTLLVVRCFTEVPLALVGYGNEFLMHLLLMMTVASVIVVQARREPQPVPVSPPAIYLPR